MTLSQQRDLVRAFWRGEPTPCPLHTSAQLRAEHVRTTHADHLVFTCPEGGEVTTVPQRPRQVEFNPPQVEGLLLNIERGDAILCYRCQSKLAVESDDAPGRPSTRMEFICVRCLSWGTWNREIARAG
ncbi:MAG TPA: hypothetical protein VMS56_02970 [Thermoanaerobaculia bacterium]|nr:hypothetical protein [Thermoanaerobaculia bacterium]